MSIRMLVEYVCDHCGFRYVMPERESPHGWFEVRMFRLSGDDEGYYGLEQFAKAGKGG